jgi:16S rRNA (uracil1498-N3)-methyltransferase
MVPRVYAPSLGPGDRTVALPADEADHLRRVLRVKPGAAIHVFDGRGREFAARVASVGRDAVVAEVGEPVAAAPEWRVGVTLAQAVLKGDKIDDVIRDAVMMGVAAIRPLLTERTDVPPAAFGRGGRTERWHRIAVASAKQCGRAVVPEILPLQSLPACLEAADADLRLMMVEPRAAAGRRAAAGLSPAPASALLVVGPEGGWTQAEVDAAIAAGCGLMTLGERTLRADAAPIVALAVLQCAWGEVPGFGARDR